MTQGSVLAARRELYQQFPVAPVAFSVDGSDFHFAGPLDLGLRVGGFAVTELPDNILLVLHVSDVRLVERSAATLSVPFGHGETASGMPSATVAPILRAVTGSARVLGALTAEGFTPSVSSRPVGESPLRPATATEIATIVDGIDSGVRTITVGTLEQAPEVPARLRAKGFARHTFMCGQSGSGKTYTTGVLFERLLLGTGLPLVVIDPNSDHVHLGRLRDDEARTTDHDRYRDLASGVRVAAVRGSGTGTVLCADFSDLDLSVQALLLRLEPIRDLDDFAMLRSVTSRLSAPYSISDVARAAAADPAATQIATRIDNLGLADWALWRRDGEKSIVGDALSRCTVLDTGSLSRPDERAAVSLVFLGNRWARRRDRQPMLIAIDEAHNVFPAFTDDPLLARTTDCGALVGGEGRKFGLHLFIASQRPAKVHPNVVSQCDNLILMRMNGVGDVADLERLFSHLPGPLLHRSLTFGLGQALFAGPVSPVPMLARAGQRLTPEGGGDVPTTWA